MTLFYVLAKTVVNGEIVIQGISITYSASASGFDSANTSFKDAAKVATIASNSAAIIAARKTVDSILAQYSYVLSEEDITSMISNSLTTNIYPLRVIALKRIASTVDGINYVVNKNVYIGQDEMLLIPNQQSLILPNIYTLKGTGIIQVGTGTAPLTSNDKLKAVAVTCNPAFVWAVGTTFANTLPVNVAVGGCCTITGPASGSAVTFANSNTFTNSGTTTIQNANFLNTSIGNMTNTATGTVLIRPN